MRASLVLALTLVACGGSTGSVSPGTDAAGPSDAASPDLAVAASPDLSMKTPGPDLGTTPADLAPPPDLAPAQPTSGNFSCDYVVNGIHSCTDYAWSGGTYDTSALRSACMNAKATVGTGCTHTGSAGGCRTSSNLGPVTLTTTNWYYTPTYSPSIVMAACGTTTYVAP